MPRKSKTQNTNVISPGQPYGIAGEQQAAMKSVPLPQTRIEGNTSPSTDPMSSQEGTMDSVASPDAMQQLLSNAQSTPAPSLNAFSAPTERPEENLMTMPEKPISGIPNRTAEILRMVARFQNNDPLLLQKAADAERLRY